MKRNILSNLYLSQGGCLGKPVLYVTGNRELYGASIPARWRA